MRKLLDWILYEEPAKIGGYVAAFVTFALMVVHDPEHAANWLDHAFHSAPVAGAGHGVRRLVTPQRRKKHR